MEKKLTKNVLEKRTDGFFISYATLSDYERIQDLVDYLSPETKKFFSVWLFNKKPRFKVKMGQWIAKLSLCPGFKKIIKKIFPYGFVIILKVESASELVGYQALYFFKLLNDGTFKAKNAGAISEKFQGVGLGTWIRSLMLDVAKKENVSLLEGGVYSDNKKILKIMTEKLGWKIVGVKKNVKSEYDGLLRDQIQLVKKISKD